MFKYANLGLSLFDFKITLVRVKLLLIELKDLPASPNFVPSVHEPEYIEFITRLRNERKAQNLTQVQLAERLGELQSYVAKVETSERRLDVIEAAEWCIALGITFKDVMPHSLQAALENASHYQKNQDDNG